MPETEDFFTRVGEELKQQDLEDEVLELKIQVEKLTKEVNDLTDENLGLEAQLRAVAMGY